MSIPWSKEQLMKANAKLMVKVEELQKEINQLKNDKKILKDIISADVKHNVEY